MIHPPKTDDHTIRGKVVLKVKSKKVFSVVGLPHYNTVWGRRTLGEKNEKPCSIKTPP